MQILVDCRVENLGIYQKYLRYNILLIQFGDTVDAFKYNGI